MSYLAYLRSQQLYLDAKNENAPYNIDVSKILQMHKKMIVVNKNKVDFISNCPYKISSKILGMLDTRSLSYAERVSKKWKALCEHELMKRKIHYYNDSKIEGTDAYFEQLWQLLMLKIEKTYGEPFPF